SANIANYHRLIGQLPMLLHPDPKRALVIGLGGGATAGALALYSGTEGDVVELSSAGGNSAPPLAESSGWVRERPTFPGRVDDGPNYLLPPPGGYDVITADTTRPEHAGGGSLSSRQYFELARDALAVDGLMLQWLEQLSDEQYR